MHIDLFSKYTKQIQKQKNTKLDIIDCIQKNTSIILTEKEITIEEKKVTIQTSSIKNTKIRQSNISLVLLKQGYVLQ